jgi:hypothetical protein
MPSLKQKRKLSAEEMKDIFLADRKTGEEPHETDILGGGEWKLPIFHKQVKKKL